MSDKVAMVYNAVLELVNKQNNPFKITVSEIADKSGIGKGTVYEYFKSKDDIFIKTFKYFSEKVIENLEAIECNSFREMFDEFYNHLVKMQSMCNAAYLTIMFGDSRLIVTEDLSVKINLIIEPLNKSMENYITMMIAKGIEEGIVSTLIEPINVYFASMGVVTMVFAANSPIEKISENKHLIDVESCYKAFIKQLG